MKGLVKRSKEREKTPATELLFLVALNELQNFESLFSSANSDV